MRLLILFGFFGAGKTTLIIKLAKNFVRRNKKVAIVVNDVGKIGIDDKVIEHYGLKVKEIFGGCICCQLGTDLVETLDFLEKNYNPEIVILEPSGGASPEALYSTLKYVRELKIIYFPKISLIDATQFNVLIEVIEPLIKAQIKNSDIVLINKIDVVLEKNVEEIKKDIKKINEKSSILPISALENINMNELISILEV
ncbi:MAG: GTP-binding protein [Candidatus Methanofastidiosia archaeon]